MYAKFQGDLIAGNVNFSIENTDSLLLKRRIKGNFNWVNLFSISIDNVKDFQINLFDSTVRSQTDYDYALVPVFGDVEGGYIISSIQPHFNGLFISNRDSYIKTVCDVDINTQKQNKPNSVVNTMGEKYPFVISNGKNNYKSGSLSAVFAENYNDNCTFDFKNAWRYREYVNAFLFDDSIKLIKYEDGRMWLASISNEAVSESENGHPYFVKTSFEWVEVGDCDSGNALYKAGLVDLLNLT